jgi:hypothetical protein
MRKFVIAIEVDLDGQEAADPKKWIRNTIGSVRMRKVAEITYQEIHGDNNNVVLKQQHKAIGAKKK